MKPIKLALLVIVLMTTAFVLYAGYQMNKEIPIEETGPQIKMRDHAIV